MNLEITSKKIIYEGKEYVPQYVKVNITIKNKAKGHTRLIVLVLLYTVIFLALFTPPIFKAIYNYMILINFPLLFMFFMVLILLLNKYFLEYAVIEFGNDRKLTLLYSREKKVLVNKIIQSAGVA